jgi:hypothetical protein
MITVFNFEVHHSAIFAPKKSNTSITIGKESINLSMIDCLDVDLSNGFVVVRNKIMGNNVIVSDKGETMQFNRSQLMKFVNGYKDRFVLIKKRSTMKEGGD